jgi:hypothetical protein
VPSPGAGAYHAAVLVWAVPLAVVIVGLVATVTAVGRVAEEARRLGDSGYRWAELRASWWPLRREAGELGARLGRRRRR